VKTNPKIGRQGFKEEVIAIMETQELQP